MVPFLIKAKPRFPTPSKHCQERGIKIEQLQRSCSPWAALEQHRHRVRHSLGMGNKK